MNIDLKKHVWTNLKEKGLYLFFQIILALLLPFVTNPESFGLLSIIINNITFALIFTGLGFTSALTYHASKKSDETKHLIRFFTVTSLFQFAIICLFELAFRNIQNQFLLWPTNNLFLGLSGIILFTGLSLIEKVSASCNGLLKTGMFIRISSLFLFIQILLLAINHFLKLSVSVLTPILIIVFSTLVQGIILYVYLVSLKQKNEKDNNPIQWKVHLSFALPAYAANLIQFLATRSDLWLIDFFGTKTEVGYYAFATKLGQLLLVLPLLFASIVFPLLTSGKLTNQTFEKIIRVSNSTVILINIISFLSAVLFIPLIWGDQYVESTVPFAIMIPGFFAQSQITLYAAYFASRSKIRVNIMSSCLTLFILLILDLILIPLMGIRGAAASLTIANIAAAIWIIRKYNTENHKNTFRIFPLKEDLEGLKSIFTS